MLAAYRRFVLVKFSESDPGWKSCFKPFLGQSYPKTHHNHLQQTGHISILSVQVLHDFSLFASNAFAILKNCIIKQAK